MPKNVPGPTVANDKKILARTLCADDDWRAADAGAAAVRQGHTRYQTSRRGTRRWRSRRSHRDRPHCPRRQTHLGSHHRRLPRDAYRTQSALDARSQLEEDRVGRRPRDTECCRLDNDPRTDAR